MSSVVYPTGTDRNKIITKSTINQFQKFTLNFELEFEIENWNLLEQYQAVNQVSVKSRQAEEEKIKQIYIPLPQWSERSSKLGVTLK